MRIGQGLVFAHQLNRKATRRCECLEVIVQVKVIVGPPDVACEPASRDIDEEDIELQSTGIKALNGTYQALGENDVRP